MQNLKGLTLALAIIAVGLFFAICAWETLDVGTTRRMGPGFFPLSLGVLLTLLGLCKLIQSLTSPRTGVGPIAWRGAGLVTLSTVFFAVSIGGLGLFPAVAGSAVMASFSSRDIRLTMVLAITAGLSLLCYAIFVFALSVPLPLIGPWLRGWI